MTERMRRRGWLLGLTLALALVAAACGGADDAGGSSSGGSGLSGKIVVDGSSTVAPISEAITGIRLGAYALGATKWQTVRRQVLPAAMPGTLTGTILALSRAIGETAPLLVIGLPIVIFSLPNDLRDPVSALPLLIFDWTSRPQPAFAEASIVLLALLLAMNAVAIFLRNRYTIRW
jgi:ABC-type phosphate transport system permease subunit